MYENRNKRGLHIDLPSFNFPKFKRNKKARNTLLNIIAKLAIVCLFFFIFIICISRFGKDINSKDYNTNSFNPNLTYIKDTILKYYDNQNNLPKINGDSSSYTIDELTNKKIIKKSKIDNYQNCNLKKSYIVVTKTRDKMYDLKVALICNDIEEELEYTFKK